MDRKTMNPTMATIENFDIESSSAFKEVIFMNYGFLVHHFNVSLSSSWLLSNS
jgi:hypothetical protein